MRIIIVASTLVLGWFAHASTFQKGFVQIRETQRIYVEYKKATPGEPTLFLVNGLTYSTRQWSSFAHQLIKQRPGVGIVLFDMEGQGRTLLDKAPIRFDIPIEQQVRDLKDLREALRVQGPVSLLGLSYGGAVALLYASIYPDDFDHVIATAPFLERLEDQDLWIKNSRAAHRTLYPFDPRSDEELYDFYLRALISSTYPLAEPIILENPFKLEGVYRMVKGAKNWRAITKSADLPKGRIHIIGAERDEHIKLDKLTSVALAYEQSGALGSYLIVEGSRHKVPEVVPRFTAAWTNLLLSNNPNLSQGRKFFGSPRTGEAQSGELVIPVTEKAGICETLLRTINWAS